MVLDFSPRILEAEAGRSPEFEASQEDQERPCLKKGSRDLYVS